MQTATLNKAFSYTIDPNHSTVHFWVRHMMVAKVHGELSDVTGTVITDLSRPEEPQTAVTLHATTLTTRNDQRDGHLKSADFLNTEQFPTITFKSRRVSPAGENRFDITGD